MPLYPWLQQFVQKWTATERVSRNGTFVRLHTNTVTDVRDVNREEEREREEKPRIFYYEICSFLCRCFVEISTFVFCSVPRHLNKMAIQMMVMASKHENKMEQTALGKKWMPEFKYADSILYSVQLCPLKW